MKTSVVSLDKLFFRTHGRRSKYQELQTAILTLEHGKAMLIDAEDDKERVSIANAMRNYIRKLDGGEQYQVRITGNGQVAVIRKPKFVPIAQNKEKAG